MSNWNSRPTAWAHSDCRTGPRRTRGPALENSRGRSLRLRDRLVGIQVLSITTVSKHRLCQRLRFGLPISARNGMVGKRLATTQE